MDAKVENFKEIAGKIRLQKSDEVSRPLGDSLGNLEIKSEKLSSQIENLKKKLIDRNPVTPRPENSIQFEIGQPMHSMCLGDISQEIETSHQQNNQIQKGYSLIQGLGNMEIALPQFDDSKETNPMFHLKQLEKYFDLKKIPLTHQLAVACTCKSIVGSLPKQRLQAISDRFRNYDFRLAFVNTWWSPSQQSLEKCKLLSR
jgi:hypothetical protein